MPRSPTHIQARALAAIVLNAPGDLPLLPLSSLSVSCPPAFHAVQDLDSSHSLLTQTHSHPISPLKQGCPPSSISISAVMPGERHILSSALGETSAGDNLRAKRGEMQMPVARQAQAELVRKDTHMRSLARSVSASASASEVGSDEDYINTNSSTNINGNVNVTLTATGNRASQQKRRAGPTGGRPYKRPRVDDADGDVSMSSASSNSGSDTGDVKEKDGNTPTPMRVSPSPYGSGSVPPPLSSASSSSTVNARFASVPRSHGGSPFPTTPPSGASGSMPPQSMGQAQPFWLEDGDLVVLVSSSTSGSSYEKERERDKPSFASFSSSFFPPSVSAPSPSNPSFPTFPSSNSNSSFFPPSSSFLNPHPYQSNPHPQPAPPTSFRIHAARLAAASSVFASLLSSPLPASPNREDSARAAREIATKLRQATTSRVSAYDSKGREEELVPEYVAGYPAIRLEGESPRDWIVTLEAIYEPLSFQIRPVVFETLAGVLRVATRYGVRQLREWAAAQLRTIWPSNVERMAPVALPHAADAIALARACDVPDILPAAFYALAVQRWRPSPASSPIFGASPSARSTSGYPFATVHPSPSPVDVGGTDGGRAHAVLSPEDMRRLVCGREALQDLLIEIVAAPLVVGASMWGGAEEDGREDMPLVMNAGDAMPGAGATYPPSPAPSPSPKSPVMAPMMIGEPALETAAEVSEAPMISVSEISTFHQPAPSHPFGLPSIGSASSIASSSTSSTTTAFVPFSPFPSTSASTLASGSTSTSKDASSHPYFIFCAGASTSCRNALETLWRARLVPAGHGRRAWGTWLARELHRLATLPRAQFLHQSGCDNGGFGVGYACSEGEGESLAPSSLKNGDGEPGGKTQTPVCVRCWEENRRLALWRLDWLCAQIPGMFML